MVIYEFFGLISKVSIVIIIRYVGGRYVFYRYKLLRLIFRVCLLNEGTSKDLEYYVIRNKNIGVGRWYFFL